MSMAIITGASSGLGREYALAVCRLPCADGYGIFSHCGHFGKIKAV